MTWDSYLDLEAGVLRNRLGVTNADELARAEASFTAVRLAQLAESPLPGHCDRAHLQAFHRHIFGDVYDWAGELRTVSIGKGGGLFCPPERIASTADGIFAALARVGHLRGPDRPDFVDLLAGLLGSMNSLHPFREGNGRTQRAFLAQLARAAGHPIRWAAMNPAVNVAASRAAHRDGNTDSLRAMLDELVARP